MCINDRAQTLVWILEVLPQLNINNLLCWLAGRNNTSFAWQIFIWVKRFASVEPGRKFIGVFRKSTNYVHGAESVVRR